MYCFVYFCICLQFSINNFSEMKFAVNTCQPVFKYYACVSLLGLPWPLLGGRNVFSHESGDWNSKMKVSAGLISSEVFLIGLSPLMVLPLYVSLS